MTQEQQFLEVLGQAHNPHWVHNAAITNDIEALRRICLYYSTWWNDTAWPAIVALHGDEAKALTWFEGLGGQS
jgi:hypothetical protein